MRFRRSKLDKALDQCLERVQMGQDLDTVLGSFPDLVDQLRPRIEAVIWFEQQKENLEPPPGFLAASRHRLLEQIRQASPTLPVRASFALHKIRRTGRRYQWVMNSVAIGLFLLVLASVIFQGIELVSASIPGDHLYSTKLLLEEAHLTLSLDSVRDAHLLVEYSKRRSDEISALIFEGRLDYLELTVDAFRTDVSRSRHALRRIQTKYPDEAEMLQNNLSEMVESQNIILGLLIQAVPDQARVEIQQAMKVSLK